MDLPRHLSGKASFAALLDSWIEISRLNPLDWSLLATDALGVSKLHASQISALRRGVTTHLGVMVLDAIAAINSAAWKFHREQKSILKGIHAHKISQIPPLECDGQAADAADFLLIYLGLQDSPTLPEGWLGVQQQEPVEAESDSELSKMAGQAIRSAIRIKCGSDDFIDGFAAFLAHYPTNDRLRLRRLREICFGLDDFTSAELEVELVAICLALQGFTGESWNIRKLVTPATPVLPH